MIPSGAITCSVKGFYLSRNKVEKAIFHHACVSGGAALLPIPGAAAAINLANQVVMYGHINSIMGVSFSKHVTKCIGKFLLSQLGGAGVGLGMIIAGEGLKFIPGLGSLIGGALGLLAWPTVTYSCGWIYYKTLISLAESNTELTEDNIKTAIREQCADKDALRDLKADAKRNLKDVDFKNYREEAKTYSESNE